MISKQDLSKALEARERAAATHVFDPNVSLVDVGWRVKESAGRALQPELTVRVHVRHKIRGADFESFAMAQPERVVSDDRIGYACDVIECDYRLHASVAAAAPAPATDMGTAEELPTFPRFQPPPPAATPRLPRIGRYRPLQGGASCIQQFGTAATLGGFVQDRSTGEYMILSNFHVLAGHAFAPPGLRTLQPSPQDGGAPGDAVATLVRDAMSDSMDAAVATLLPGMEFVNYQIDLGGVTGRGLPALDMIVTKSGRTTGVTTGIVDGIGGSGVLINYGGFSRLIKNVIHIVPAAATTGMVSAGGDSGSWWLDQDSRQAVALHFAGSADFQNYALAIQMPQVLDSLQVDLVI